MKAYKLTSQSGQTYNGTQWREGVTHTATGKGNLCSSGWIHFYDDPELAVIFNPIHANFHCPILWEAEADLPWKEDKGIKFGSKSVTTIRKLELPIVTQIEIICFGIVCAKLVTTDKEWNNWAEKYLSGKDRTKKASYDAAANAADAVRAAAATAADAAWRAASDAADARAAWRANAADAAAADAVRAANAAANAAATIDLKDCLKQAKVFAAIPTQQG